MRHTKRSVVITGVGCISALGEDVQAFQAALAAGHSAIGPLQTLPLDQLRIKVGAEIADYDAEAHFSARERIWLDRFTQFALLAAEEAITDAGLEFDAALGARTAVMLGSGISARHTNDESLETFYAHGKRIPANAILKGLPSAPSSHISIRYGLTGPSSMSTVACSSSNDAIARAYSMINQGLVDVAICGGSESCITLPFWKGWEALRIMAKDTCRPFSLDRSGFVLGEGAGILVLESMEHATARGASCYAELAGYGMSSDAGDMLLPSVEGAASAMQQAMHCADLQASDIDYINAHGTGTAGNDPVESKAIREIFKGHADSLAVSSTKSMHGHALGASGAMELIATAIAMRDSLVPPTANYTTPDPQCDLDYVPNSARSMPVQAALSNSFAFGGINVVLAMKAI